MSSSSSSSISITTIVQYAVFAVIAYVLAGAPQPSSLTSIYGSNNNNTKTARRRAGKEQFSLEKVESLIAPIAGLNCDEEQGYKVHIFNREPLVIYIEGFLKEEESNRILEISEDHWSESTIWTNGQETTNTAIRHSSKAPLDSNDPTIACIAQRARHFQGWRPNVFIEKLWSQRYLKSGHYMYHYDFSSPAPGSGRVSTFMVYVDANCTGGGTNFPRIERPAGKDWCRFIECEENGLTDGAGGTVEGVVFKPIKGNAVFWENLRSDGSGYPETWHAGLPVKEGVKVGLNIWSWWQDGWEAHTIDDDKAEDVGRR